MSRPTKYEMACDEFAHSHRYGETTAGREIAVMITISYEIWKFVDLVQCQHAELEEAKGSPFDPRSVASQIVDALGLSPKANDVLMASVEGRFPALKKDIAE